MPRRAAYVGRFARARVEHELDAIADPELPEDPVQVGLHGVLADGELPPRPRRCEARAPRSARPPPPGARGHSSPGFLIWSARWVCRVAGSQTLSLATVRIASMSVSTAKRLKTTARAPLADGGDRVGGDFARGQHDDRDPQDERLDVGEGIALHLADRAAAGRTSSRRGARAAARRDPSRRRSSPRALITSSDLRPCRKSR